MQTCTNSVLAFLFLHLDRDNIVDFQGGSDESIEPQLTGEKSRNESDSRCHNSVGCDDSLEACLRTAKKAHAKLQPAP